MQRGFCNKKNTIVFLLGIIFLLFPVQIHSQTESGVRDQIRQAEAEIVRINNLLGSTRKEQGSTLTQLKLVESKLANRQTILSGLEKEISTVSRQIAVKQEDIQKLENRIEELKCSYSALIRISYKNYKNNSFLSFIFSAKDFTDASRRLYYVKQIASELEKQAEKLQELGEQLEEELTVLNKQKSELAGLKKQHAGELRQLEDDKKELKRTQDDLKSRESDLLAQAEKRRKQITELERKLQQMVKDEVRKPVASDAAGLTAAFEARQGSMLRPTEGVIVDRYGLNNHPTQKGVKINNKGINIAAKAGAEVYNIFDGEVRKVFFFQGLGNSVMVRHGSYLTIYANLSDVFVREGDKVSKGEILGSVASAPQGQQPTLHFEVWKESTNLNPEEWIVK